MAKKPAGDDVDVDELEHAAELAGELVGDVADALECLGFPPFELVCVQSALTLLREMLRRGSPTRVARLAAERAVAELEAAERDLLRNVGHGSRRGPAN